MIRYKVTENHQDTKFWPNLHSFIGKWKITLFLDDTAEKIYKSGVPDSQKKFDFFKKKMAICPTALPKYCRKGNCTWCQ